MVVNVIKAGDQWPLICLTEWRQGKKKKEFKHRPLRLPPGTRVFYNYISKRTGKPVRRPLRIVDAKKGLVRPPTQAPAGVQVEIEIVWPNDMHQILNPIEIVRPL